jgi:hypothetical protein
MSRNRVKNSQSLHWIGVIKWVVIAGLLSVLGLSYMLCKNQNVYLAVETHRSEVQLAAIMQRNESLTYDLEAMKSPIRLQRRLAEMHSSLIRLSDMGSMVVRMDQIIHAVVPKSGAEPMAELNDGIYPTTAAVASSGGAASSSRTAASP